MHRLRMLHVRRRRRGPGEGQGGAERENQQESASEFHHNILPSYIHSTPKTRHWIQVLQDSPSGEK